MSVAPTLTASQLSGLKTSVAKINKAQKVGKIADAANLIIGIGGDAATQIISTTGAIKNQALQDDITRKLQDLDEKQASELGRLLSLTKSQDAKLEQMTMYLANIQAKQLGSSISSNIQNQILGKTKKNRNTMYWIFGGSIAFFLIIAIAIKLKNKK
jgi:K+/H+ antiporter YhaU regulatory subunit KhtT